MNRVDGLRYTNDRIPYRNIPAHWRHELRLVRLPRGRCPEELAGHDGHSGEPLYEQGYAELRDIQGWHPGHGPRRRERRLHGSERRSDAEHRRHDLRLVRGPRREG